MTIRHALPTRHSIWHPTAVWRHLNALPGRHPIHQSVNWGLGLVAILSAKSLLLHLILWDGW